MKIRLTKIKDCETPLYTNHIPEDYVVEGEFVQVPLLGEGFKIGNFWITSRVTKIVDNNTFETLNSIYNWEYIKT